jgi:hypothetical protein
LFANIERHTIAEALFNRIEIWRVWWQEKKDTTETLNNFSKCMCLVDCTVVKDQYALVLGIRVHICQLEDSFTVVEMMR